MEGGREGGRDRGKEEREGERKRGRRIEISKLGRHIPTCHSRCSLS